MIARRQYRNPPIEEALCEFHFVPGPKWDFTVSGKLHTKLATQYPGKPQEQKSHETDVNINAGKPSRVKYRERLERVRLVSADGKRMVSVGHDVMSVHMLRPYQDPNRLDKNGWDEFLPRISEALDAYWEVAEPTKISRIGVRYINKIVIPQERTRFAGLFATYPAESERSATICWQLSCSGRIRLSGQCPSWVDAGSGAACAGRPITSC